MKWQSACLCSQLILNSRGTISMLQWIVAGPTQLYISKSLTDPSSCWAVPDMQLCIPFYTIVFKRPIILWMILLFFSFTMMHLGVNFLNFFAWNLLDLLNDIGIFCHFWKVLSHNITKYFLCFILSLKLKFQLRIYIHTYVFLSICAIFWPIFDIFHLSELLRSSLQLFFFSDLLILCLDVYNLLFNQSTEILVIIVFIDSSSVLYLFKFYLLRYICILLYCVSYNSKIWSLSICFCFLSHIG